MGALSRRIAERRQDYLVPLRDRRITPDDRRVPAWIRRAKDGALYGFDQSGRPVAGKDFTGRSAA